jgi:hypothetical protein
MATYYVSNDSTGSPLGSNLYSGTSPTIDGGGIGPWLTINFGANQLLAGDTLWIRAGTYDEEVQWSGSYPKGEPDFPILVKNYNDEVVTIQPTGSPDWCFNFFDTEYITIDGLILDGVNVTWDVVKITIGSSYASHHIRVTNCELKNCPNNQGLLEGGDSNEVSYCHIHHTGPGTGNQHHGIYWAGTNGLIEHNNVHDNTSHGIQQYTGAGNKDNNIIRYNKFYDNPGTGIITGSGDNNRTYNNLIWGNGGNGITVGYTSATNCQVYNNTIYNNTLNAIAYSYTSGTHYIRNNIFFANNVNAIVEGPSASSATIIDDNSNISADPNFVSVTPTDPDFLKIDETSTAVLDVGYGEPDLATIVTDDYIGTPRPQNFLYDVGAYELVYSIPILSSDDLVTGVIETQSSYLDSALQQQIDPLSQFKQGVPQLIYWLYDPSLDPDGGIISEVAIQISTNDDAIITQTIGNVPNVIGWNVYGLTFRELIGTYRVRIYDPVRPDLFSRSELFSVVSNPETVGIV